MLISYSVTRILACPNSCCQDENSVRVCVIFYMHSLFWPDNDGPPPMMTGSRTVRTWSDFYRSRSRLAKRGTSCNGLCCVPTGALWRETSSFDPHPGTPDGVDPSTGKPLTGKLSAAFGREERAKALTYPYLD